MTDLDPELFPLTCFLKVLNKCVFEQLNRQRRRLLTSVDFDSWLSSSSGQEYVTYTGGPRGVQWLQCGTFCSVGQPSVYAAMFSYPACHEHAGLHCINIPCPPHRCGRAVASSNLASLLGELFGTDSWGEFVLELRIDGDYLIHFDSLLLSATAPEVTCRALLLACMSWNTCACCTQWIAAPQCKGLGGLHC